MKKYIQQAAFVLAGIFLFEHATADNSLIDHKIMSTTVAQSPNNRGRTKVGVGEQVLLTIDPDHPATWKISGPGKINGGTDPVTGAQGVIFEAPDTTPTVTPATATAAAVYKEATTTITATCEKDGVAAPPIVFTTVRPSGLKFVFSHWNNNPNATAFSQGPIYFYDFFAEIYVLPDDVNFSKISIQEGACLATTTGFYDQYKNNTDPGVVAFMNHPPGGAIGMDKHVQGFGTLAKNPDHISHAPSIAPPYTYTAGTFTLDIPTSYSLNGDKGEFAKGKFVAEISIDANNKIKMTGVKNGPAPPLPPAPLVSITESVHIP